tara:strand:+ start:2518 stop:3501 length:984 start_codon:yes stop_codon:yes gene_type:complete
MSNTILLWTIKKFSAAVQPYIQSTVSRIEGGETLQSIPENSGLAHTEVQEPTVNFNPAPSQHEISHKNSYIVLGTDRPAGLASGYGAKGAQGANTIDLVVGRMSSASPADGAIVDSNFGADAARIYISQMTDVDTNFGLADGNIGSIKGHSAIGIKADGVRIVAREGVKIVTGKSDAFRGFGSGGEPNALGGAVETAPPIELIAGNNTGVSEVPGVPFTGAGETINFLQGIARGENTRDAIQELADMLEEVIGALMNLTLIQAQFNSILGVTPIYPHAAAAPVTALQFMSKVQMSLWQTRINKIIWEINHLQPYGYKYICSKNVFAT